MQRVLEETFESDFFGLYNLKYRLLLTTVDKITNIWNPVGFTPQLMWEEQKLIENAAALEEIDANFGLKEWKVEAVDKKTYETGL